MVEKIITPKVRAAVIRTVRTAAVAFVAVIGATWFKSPPLASAIWKNTLEVLDFAAGSALLAGAGTFGLNMKNPITPEVKE